MGREGKNARKLNDNIKHVPIFHVYVLRSGRECV